MESFKKNIAKYLNVLAKDLLLTEKEKESAFKLLDTLEVNSGARPSSYAVKIIYEVNPAFKKQLLLTENVAKNTFYRIQT